MRRFLIAAAVAALATPAFAGTTVLENFDSFNPANLASNDFTSDYTFAGVVNTVAGEYNVAPNGFPWNPNFASIADHTTGSGNYMIVNGSGDTSAVVWANKAPVTLAAGTYDFQFFLTEVCCNTGFNAGPGAGVDPSPPTLKIQIGDTVISPTDVTISGSDHSWMQVDETFTVGATASATFMIFDTNTQPNGNDFGLDDISVSGGVPEPASWALMLLGFGGLGAALRSRRRGLIAAA